VAAATGRWFDSDYNGSLFTPDLGKAAAAGSSFLAAATQATESAQASVSAFGVSQPYLSQIFI
jgi:hypothetical protein